MVSLSKEKKTLQVCFQRHSLGTKHPISYCRRQETIMHIIFLCCWHTEAITVTPSHRPPPVSSSPGNSVGKNSRQNKFCYLGPTAPRLGFLSPTPRPPAPSAVQKGFYFIYFFFLLISKSTNACQHFSKSARISQIFLLCD